MKQIQSISSKKTFNTSPSHKSQASDNAPTNTVTASNQADEILNLQRTFGNQATIQMMAAKQTRSPSSEKSASNFFAGLKMVNRKETLKAIQSHSNDTIQRVALTQQQFGNGLSDLLYGDSYLTAKNALGRRFTTDLTAEAKGDYDSSKIMQIGNPVTKFVSTLDAALKYRASKATIVKQMQQTNAYANFGDTTPTGEVLRGGTDNAWDSLNVDSLPKPMQSKMPGYVTGLHHSLSMSGKGYDYRPSKGVLFHIKK